ncbi:phosphonate metabolism transcriptional regulator PhnF [Dongia sedimenti]|uniref:Phosphonate metabolism transcriptional regulator PhnF n=1 Tax=Dongia sedimenti TaxID=3064282 RepID=A0ABU0YTL7_9PROT|nr:phosphonate metabolism transcriptional regulator PhnF [Rhodospirillaceae bacterium R-7]
MERGGINLWKQIGETLAEEIGAGVLSPGERLPASVDLASRFGVNQHTVLRAISHLQNEGLVRIERGRGTFVADAIPYRMGQRTRFEENLREQNYTPSRELLSIRNMPASTAVAAALSIKAGDPVTLVTVLAIADGIPISHNQNYFPDKRLPGIGDAFRAAADDPKGDLATKAILASLGVADYRRRTVRIRGRQATAEEVRHLRMAPQDSVFEVDVVNVDAKERPVAFGQTSFCLSRVEFVWHFPDEDMPRRARRTTGKERA